MPYYDGFHRKVKRFCGKEFDVHRPRRRGGSLFHAGRLFMGRASYGSLVGNHHVRYGHDASRQRLKLVVQRPKEVLVGCAAHYTIMPLLAYGLVLAFEMPPEMAVGMILLGSCPSGTASNVMGFLAKADVPLSVSITTCSTLLAPIMMPLSSGLAGQWLKYPLRPWP